MVGGTHVGWIALGQTDQGDAAENRRAADKWLKQAREAMKNGNLDLAEYCIERAEKLNVKPDPLLAPFKDTPAKARKDLDALRSEQGKPKSAASSPLSKLFNQDRRRAGQQPPSDPYTRPVVGCTGHRGAGTSAPAAFPGATEAMTRLPNTASASEMSLPRQGATLSLGDTAGNNRQLRSAELLREARKTLAKGDAPRAMLLVGQAKQLGLEYPLNADSPDKVEALIRRASVFSQGPAAGMDTARVHARIRPVPDGPVDRPVGLCGLR